MLILIMMPQWEQFTSRKIDIDSKKISAQPAQQQNKQSETSSTVIL